MTYFPGNKYVARDLQHEHPLQVVRVLRVSADGTPTYVRFNEQTDRHEGSIDLERYCLTEL